MNDTLILMVDNRIPTGNSEEFWGVTAYINYKYAKHNGYDFKYVYPYAESVTESTNFACIHPQTGKPRHTSWSKILAVHSALKEYSRVVYIDSDAAFNNLSSLDQLLEEYANPEKKTLFCTDYPWRDDKPCSGFFVAYNTPETFKFLERWYCDSHHQEGNSPGGREQGALSLWRLTNLDLLPYYLLLPINQFKIKGYPEDASAQASRKIINHYIQKDAQEIKEDLMPGGLPQDFNDVIVEARNTLCNLKTKEYDFKTSKTQLIKRNQEKRKTLVLMVDNRQPSYNIKAYHNLTAYANYTYAKTLGYDFKYIVPVLDTNELIPAHIRCRDPKDLSGRHVAWAKIIAIYSELSKYDTVIYLDSDAYFNRLEDVYTQVKYDTYQQPIKLLSDKPYTDKPCSGVVFVDNSSEARAELKNWYTAAGVDKKYNLTHTWEQAYIHQVTSKAIVQLPVNQFKLDNTNDDKEGRLIVSHVPASNSKRYQIIYNDIAAIFGLESFAETIEQIITNNVNVLDSEEACARMYGKQERFDVAKYAKYKKYRSILKIGSNDGVRNDAFYPFVSQDVTIRALFVDPMSYLLEQARKAHKHHKNIKYVQLAIAETSGEKDFFFLDESVKKDHPNVPDYYTGIGSFSSTHIAKHFGNNYSEYIRKVPVATDTLNNLLEREEFTSFDILHIDTEGYDWQVLKQLPLDKILPELIYFEHKHLNARDIEAALNYLEEYYDCVRLFEDFVCFKR
jgi:FkbM family methyltransferase